MDWNGDGKHDWHDDAFLYAVTHSEDDSSDSDPNSHRSPSVGTGSGWAIVIIALIILSFFF